MRLACFTALAILFGIPLLDCLGGSPACPEGEIICTCNGNGGSLTYYCAAACAVTPSCGSAESDGGSD